MINDHLIFSDMKLDGFRPNMKVFFALLMSQNTNFIVQQEVTFETGVCYGPREGPWLGRLFWQGWFGKATLEQQLQDQSRVLGVDLTSVMWWFWCNWV